MPIKKTKKSSDIDIETVAARFHDIKTLADHYAKQAKELADAIKSYAEEHPKCFDGNTFRIGNYVRVEKRSSLKCEYDHDLVTETWVSALLENGGAEMVDLKFIPEAVEAANTQRLTALLSEIGMALHTEETLVVYKQK